MGELVFDDAAPGGFGASFQYDASWLANPAAFALDPLNLPLRAGGFQTYSKHIKLGVLMDAGPDMWGRRVYRATRRLGASEAERDVLLCGRGNGVGALLFSTERQLRCEDVPSVQSLPSVEQDLERTHAAVHQVELAQPLDATNEGLLAGSWSIGGARAKAVMRSADGRVWIVKFSQVGDAIDRIKAEYANLLMARAAGLHVPDSRVMHTAHGSALLVERFDRSAQGTRLHYASAISLISAEPQDKRLTSARDRAVFSYANIAAVIRAVSPEPLEDQRLLFTQMLLNVLLHNTDDHLKNFGFIESEYAGPKYLSLSKSFDIVTQGAAQHYLSMGVHGREGNLANALSEPRRFGLSEKAAQSIADSVVEVVANRKAFYEQADLYEQDQSFLEKLVKVRQPFYSAPR